MHVFHATSGSPVRFQDANAYCEIDPSDASWICTSDQRLKEEITELSSQDILAKFVDLKPVEFEWKTDENNEKRIGLIAQEVESIFPELVKTSPDGEHLKSVSYGGFIPYIISAIKELNTKIQALSEQVQDIANNSYSSVVSVFQKLTVGSPEKPTGITLYDEETGEPYCLSVKNGMTVTRNGECGTAPEDVTSSTLQNTLIDDSGDSSSDPAPASEPEPVVDETTPVEENPVIEEQVIDPAPASEPEPVVDETTPVEEVIEPTVTEPVDSNTEQTSQNSDNLSTAQ